VENRSSGEGSLFQRHDGLWQGSLRVGGKRKYVYGKTRKQAAERLQKLIHQASITGALPDICNRTVSDLLDRWLEIASHSLKPYTPCSYQQTCRLYIRPELGEVPVKSLSPDKLKALYNHLQESGLKRVPARAHAAPLRALRMAVLWGWLAKNPADRVTPRYRASSKKVWNAWELDAFLTSTYEH